MYNVIALTTRRTTRIRSTKTSYLLISVEDELSEDGQALFDGSEGRRRVFVTTQVRQRPRHVAQERWLSLGVHQFEKRFDAAVLDHQVTQLGPIT